MPTTTKPATPASRTPMDYLTEAIEDLDSARQSAQGEAREQIDHAVDRLRSLASDLRGRAEEDVSEFQASLDRASDHLRVELGLRAIRAQSSPEALTHLSAEIRKRKAQLAK